MPVILERAQDVEDDEMPDVNVRRRWVEAELDAQVMAALEPRTQMVLDVDLDCALAQVFEERQGGR